MGNFCAKRLVIIVLEFTLYAHLFLKCLALKDHMNLFLVGLVLFGVAK